MRDRVLGAGLVLLAVAGLLSGAFALFVMNVGPVRLDGPALVPLASTPADAVLIDGGLVVLFGLQHSVMARPAFKAWWSRWVSPSLERAVYVLASALALVVLATLWQPVAGVVYRLSAAAAIPVAGVALLGVALLVTGGASIDALALFGLRQPWCAAQGRPYVPSPFVERGPYRWVRHPLMTGTLMVLWATPTLTVNRALLNAGFSIYVLVGVYFEERTLARELGPAYEAYRRRVPMLIPWRWPAS